MGNSCELHSLALLLLGLALAKPAMGQEPVPFRALEADTVSVGYPVFPTREHGLRLVETTGSAGLTPEIDTRGLTVFDADGDGDSDVLLHASERTVGTGRSRLHLNDGRGGFRAVELNDSDLRLQAAIPADLDGDGDLDLVALRVVSRQRPWPRVVVVLRNRGDGHFTRERLGQNDDLWNPWSIALGDLDRDGRHDLVVVEVNESTIGGRVVHYDGIAGGGFSRRTVLSLDFEPSPWRKSDRSAAPKAAALLWDDDNDGDLDLQLINAGSYWQGTPETLIHRNDGGRLSTEPRRHRKLRPSHRSQSLLLADFDRDLRIDVFQGVSDFQGGRNRLLGTGHGKELEAVGSGSGLWAGYSYTGAAAAGDLDADGWVDLVQPRHRSEGRTARPAIFRNRGGERFERCEDLLPAGLRMISTAAVLFDADGDLDLDLLFAAANQQGHRTDHADLVDRLFLQVADVGHSIAFRLRGTDSPRDARDSHLEVLTEQGWQLRVVGQGGVTGLSNPPLVQHVGLGAATVVEQVRVRWTSGRVEEFGRRPAGLVHDLVEGEGTSTSH